MMMLTDEELQERNANTVLFSDLLEPNGLTIRQNNLARQHKFPIGTLVHCKYDETHASGSSCRTEGNLWVIEHTRDCDGTPLYTVGMMPLPDVDDPFLGRFVLDLRASSVLAKMLSTKMLGVCCTHLSETGMTEVQVTPDLLRGVDAITWND